MSGATVAAAGAIYRRPVYLPPSVSAYDFKLDPTPATCDFGVNSSGTYVTSGTGPNTPSGTWLISGAASSYEIRLDLTSGSVTPGSSATGTWLALSSNRFWALSGGGYFQTTGTLQIRNATTLQVLITATLTLTVEIG